MRILLINKYFFIKGGAERVFFDTAQLLKDQGHEVVFFSMQHPNNFSSNYEKYFISQSQTDKPTIKDSLLALGRSFYSPEAALKLEKLIRETKPDVAHIHFFHQVAATILPILKRHNIPVVLTAHDYKLICPHYHLNDKDLSCPKNDFLHALQTIFYRRFHNSFLASLAVAVEWYWHKKTRLYEKYLDKVVTPAEFSARLLVDYGWPKEKLEVLRNFVYPSRNNIETRGRYVLFVGRLSQEKGLELLVKTARILSQVPFYVVGSGTIRLPDLPNIKFLGYKLKKEIGEIYQNAALLFFPSNWEEVCPMVILEAQSYRLPVVASNLGGVPEIVRDGQSGYLFNPRQAGAEQIAADLILDLWKDQQKQIEFGNVGREAVEKIYSPTKHSEQLIRLYASLLRLRQVNDC